MKKQIKNVSASIRQRLLNKAREQNVLFDELLKLYAMERFLFRISKSEYKNKLILKGALMLLVWDAPQSRTTQDIDLLGRIDNDLNTIADVVKSICNVEQEPDGISFDTNSIHVERITEELEYQGVRAQMICYLGTARIHMQIDIGFGDKVIPKPVEIEYPTILDTPKPFLLGYSKESSIAEKFEAMVKLDRMNSRMKDFYDIWLLSRSYDFDGRILSDAIRKTFETRGTKIEPDITAFTKEFSEDHEKSNLWNSFLEKSKLQDVPEDFPSIVKDISDFIMPVIKAIYHNEDFRRMWNPDSNWS